MFRQDLDLLTLNKEPGYQELMRKVHSPAPDTPVGGHSAAWIR